MSNTIPSPNMNLAIPVPGVDPGPDWANNINASLLILDSHNHSSGSGVPITPSGMNINVDLSFGANNAVDLRSVRMSPQSGVLAGASDLGCIYVVGDDLYYNDGSGNHVRITSGGSVTGSTGTITGLPSGTASASFGSGTFTFQSATLTAANIDGGSYILRNATASSKGLTLQPPNAMAADYSVTLPALPSALGLVTLDTSGNFGTVPTTAGIIPPGTVVMYAGASAPTGWLLCDGTSYSASSYPNLFAAIGTAYGQAGLDFTVPDMRGQFPRGVSAGSGVDPDASSRTALYPGGNTGNNIGSYQVDALRSHIHHVGVGSTGVGGNYAQGLQNTTGSVFDSGDAIGGTISTETRPVNLYFNFIIKT